MGDKVAGIGFKAHTGWATFVAVAGSANDLRVYARGRVELLPADDSIPRFVFHEASQLSDAGARDFVARAETAAATHAADGLQRIIADLRSEHVEVRTCGLIGAASEMKPGITLEKILQSHPLIHASEGKLFRDAIAHACFERGLDVTLVPEREVWARAAKVCGFSEEILRERISALRAAVGAPWGADEKVVAATAIIAAFAHPGVSSRRAGKEAAWR